VPLFSIHGTFRHTNKAKRHRPCHKHTQEHTLGHPPFTGQPCRSSPATRRAKPSCTATGRAGPAPDDAAAAAAVEEAAAAATAPPPGAPPASPAISVCTYCVHAVRSGSSVVQVHPGGRATRVLVEWEGAEAPTSFRALRAFSLDFRALEAPFTVSSTTGLLSRASIPLMNWGEGFPAARVSSHSTTSRGPRGALAADSRAAAVPVRPSA
jgi:hypothetical protein